MARPKVVCQVCGIEADNEVVYDLSFVPEEAWMIHRIEQVGGIVQVLSCPDCANISHIDILEIYKRRIRRGLVTGIH